MRRFGNLPVFCFTLACSFTIQSAEVSQLVNVAVTGEPAPGTLGELNLRSPQMPVLNAVNQTALLGDSTSGTGLWAGSPLRLAALRASNAPGTTGAQFESFVGLAIADNGQVLFQANLNGPQVTSTNNYGCWVGPPGTVQLLARTGIPIPEAGAFLHIAGITGIPQINPNGWVPLTIRLAGNGIGATNEMSLWLGRPGDLHLVARQGNPAPGFGPAIRFRTIPDGQVSLNHSNQIAFTATTTDSGALGFRSAIWIGTPQSLEAVARVEDPVPGIPGAQFLGFRTLALNDTGEVSFIATWFDLGSATSGEGVWAGKPGQIVLVAKSGDLMPGTPLRLLSANGVLLNNSGQLALHAVATNDAGAFITGIWAGTPSNLQRIVLEGTPAPGPTPDLTIALLGPQFEFQDQGWISFTADLTGPDVTASNSRSLWGGTLSEPGMLLREGDTVEVRPGSIGIINGFSGMLTSSPPGTTSLNANGSKIVWLSFTDSNLSGVFLARRLSDGTLSLVPMGQGSSLELSWTGEGFSLEEAETVQGPWNPSANQTNPQAISIQPKKVFYRLTK